MRPDADTTDMAETHRQYARDCGKRELFKFRAFAEEVQRDRVRQIILAHWAYFATRSEINDPFDLAPVLYLDDALGEADLRDKMVANAKETWQRSEPGLSPSEVKRRLVALRTCDLRAFEAEARRKVFARLEHHWIFSLAGNRDHPMLWSHYADSHKGLCIHFSTADVFGASQRVLYVKERPRFLFPINISDQELAYRCTLHKGEFWEYEEEYRFIRYPTMRLDDVGLLFQGQRAAFQPHQLTGITVGARMPEPDIKLVLEMAANHSPKLPAWRARETLAYGLEFDQLA